MDVRNSELEGPLGLTAYRVLFERATEGVIFSTLDGCLQAANPAACALLAMTEEEMLERGRAALIDPDDPGLGPWLAERSRTGAGTGEIRLRRRRRPRGRPRGAEPPLRRHRRHRALLQRAARRHGAGGDGAGHWPS